jgi:hypothetical protein
MSFLESIKSKFSRNLINILGYKTNERLVIIESDDWGSIRMSNIDAYNALLLKGYPVNQSPYNKFDSLESNEDLIHLINVLNSVKGADEKPVKFTMNNIVANPDFEKIQASNFQEYYWEPFTKTLKRYPVHNNVMDLYKKGIEQGVFFPQFHGREHLNIDRWMKALRKNDKATIDAFNLKVFSPCIAISTNYANEYMDAFDFDSLQYLKSQETILSEGLGLFEQIWGFPSKSFIAPCYIWDSSLETILANKGIKYIQGMVNQFNPIDGQGYNYKMKYHFQGQKNNLGQRYLIRNAFFEPAINPGFAWEQDCINRIEVAFRWKKPAIISSHRLNYIGFLNEENRTANLKRLKALLNEIVVKWPEVRFISSDELGNLMNREK